MDLEKFKHRTFCDGRIVMINADCEAVMAEIGDKEIDLVLTDPPYGIGFGTFNRTNKLSNGNRIKANKYHNSDWDNEIPASNIFDELRRVSDNQIIWGGELFSFSLAVCGKMLYFLEEKQPRAKFC